MLYQISDGTLTLQGKQILSHINFEIRGTERVAIVGSNGAGKTSLLRLIAGELELDTDDKRQGPGKVTSRAVVIDMLHQQTFLNLQHTVEEELMQGCPCGDRFDKEHFLYEKEYDTLFNGFGFSKDEKKKHLSEFSGGERTKIALIRLLLSRPDILLLDEPTNHLDIQAVEWLEGYLKTYDRAVVMVSHDRFFLDETAEVVYELEDGKLTRYSGNYTNYRQQKAKNLQLQQKAYEQYIEEKERLEVLIERFKHKPRKAAFARAKKKTLERLPKVEKPELDHSDLFAGEILPVIPGSKRVLECERLRIGYDKALMEVTMRIRKGQRIAILGDNGVGKTAFLKTIAGFMEPLGGKYVLGNHTVLGYFDQHTAEIVSEKRVLEHFCDIFPALSEKDARKTLSMYLFGGTDTGKKVKDLSGGEKVRLVLAELLTSRPNFLLLDEPTNHCDVRAKECLEQVFKAYKGTMLFVSHDRYFVQEVADAVFIFENGEVYYYPFGYRHYLEHSAKRSKGETLSARIKAEDQALIDGLKAVPKGERPYMRELSAEEAYEDWKLQPVRKQLEEAEEQYVWALSRIREKLEEQQASRGYWDAFAEADAETDKDTVMDAGAGTMKADKEQDEKQLEAMWAFWHQACMEWYEVWSDLESE